MDSVKLSKGREKFLKSQYIVNSLTNSPNNLEIIDKSYINKQVDIMNKKKSLLEKSKYILYNF